MDDAERDLHLWRHVGDQGRARKGRQGRPRGGCRGATQHGCRALEILSARRDQIRREGPPDRRRHDHRAMAVGHSNHGLPAAARAGAAVLAEELTSPQQQETENNMDKATYDRGLEIRKSVLGSEFVDKALASADEFNRPMQDLTTEYCW